MEKDYTQKMGKVIKIDESKIQGHLRELVQKTVEETLNKMLNAEADQLCNAKRYQRTQSITDTRVAHYPKKTPHQSQRSKIKHP